MDTNRSMKNLINRCDAELSKRGYNLQYHQRIAKVWSELLNWMSEKGLENYSEEICLQYCDNIIGLNKSINVHISDKIRVRALNMLISFQKNGNLRYYHNSNTREFTGKSGREIKTYLEYLRVVLLRKETTLSNKSYHLYLFNQFLEEQEILLNNLDIKKIYMFFASYNFTPASKHCCISTLRQYLKYAYEMGITTDDHSIFIFKDNYKVQKKLPATYEEEEVRKILASVERTSALGKRDYIIILLASEYGWRSSDIVNFRFEQIDWSKNKISFYQQKTGIDVEFPLLSSIGNAIIDYLKHGRPNTNTQEIIVSHATNRRGERMDKSTMHDVVTKYMRLANIKNWKSKRHGPHSLRHSLTMFLLKNNVSLPMISTVLGHQNTESTKSYLSIDFNQLQGCILPIPQINSTYYEV